MRLKQIKLAGFKSFVDPTSFEVPSQLVGVVGPNGCGKSNIMDAVRWVLGESKASELRGDSMQDVIFNGASERKPSGRASVELVFDNAQSRLTGAWAQYAEISVKRVLTRDGQSTYLINNQTVRRKDVHDLFLGTGLGPRAYAMIGQGTVSRIIEARPEELRVFLEEAAGVTKYKERRRETENRLSDTRENLTRVEDILRELASQIEKLERQAQVAREYRELEALREQRQQALWWVRRDEARAEQARLALSAGEIDNEIQRVLSLQRGLEAELESARQDHFDAGDAVHALQGTYYERAAEVSKLESEIQFVVQSQNELRAQQAAAAAREEQARQSQDNGGNELQSIVSQQAEAEEALAAMLARLEACSEGLPELEDRVHERRDQLELARRQVQDVQSRLQVLAAGQRAHEEALRDLDDRAERLRAAQLASTSPPEAELEQASLRLAGAEEAEAQAAEAQAQAELRQTEAESQRAPAQDALREAAARLAQVNARADTLRQIQERIRSEGRLAPWLERHGLTGLRPLWQRLTIQAGWETALEAVLRERLQSLEVGQLDRVEGLLQDQPPGRLSFHSPLPPTRTGGQPGLPQEARRSGPEGMQPLTSKVSSTDPGIELVLRDWLAGLWCADGLSEALSRRGALAEGDRIVLPEGHLVGRTTVAVHAPDSEQDGVLSRQKELTHLEKESRALELMLDEARAAAVRAESQAGQARAALAAAREALSRTMREASEARLQTGRLEQQVQRARADRDRLSADLNEVELRRAERQTALDELAAQFETLDESLAAEQDAQERARDELELAEAALDESRERLRDAERSEREADFRLRTLREREALLRGQVELAAAQRAQALSELESIQVRLAELSDDAARAGLQEALANRVRAEDELAQGRARLDALASRLRELEEQRMAREREQQPLRDRLAELQLAVQAARLSGDQFEEQLQQAGVDVDALKAAFESVPKASWLQGEVTRLTNAVSALGAVNLAALDELTQARERHAFLESQSNDLNEAIATLEDAIRKIDRETRTLLQDTFDTVNRHFGSLFPELFGGGEARLVLTGDEILDSGVTVVAQPPGKRNASINLLSGGEKALTAIALVFSLFQLNPAPFCLLDEVDAPLDEANTDRYCAMVRRMSDQTQFLFITHSKVTMELAQQLIGVTMQERGVSRIVAVDIDAAARFAEAA
ncbi:MAG: chromosome segregation protein SMC [Burkholderiaceae bacterium]